MMATDCVKSEASMYRLIRRYWKRMYCFAQREQQKSMQIVLTKQYPRWRLSSLVPVPEGRVKPTLVYGPADETTMLIARNKAKKYQLLASDYARLLNSFKSPAVAKGTEV